MTHPQTAVGGWTLEYIVYPGGVGEMAIGVLHKDSRRMMGLRWCEGTKSAASWQPGAEGWMVVPFTFAAAITRTLLQMKASGFSGFDDAGLQQLIEWMSDSDHQAIDDCICY